MVINRDYKYEYCLNCKKDHSDKQSEDTCECGSKNWIYGDKLVINEKGNFSCGCDNPSFKFVSHVNLTDVGNYTYTCTNCRAVIGKQLSKQEY